MITSTGIVRRVMGAEVDHFEQYGFVRLKRILAEGEIERLRRGVALARDTLDASPSHCDLTLFAQSVHSDAAPAHAASLASPFCGAPFGSIRQQGERSRLDDTATLPERGHYLVDSGLWRRIDTVRDYALHSELPVIAAELLGVRAVRFYNDQLIIKEPGTIERTVFHQDISYLPVDGERGCVFWLFLDRVRHGSGNPGYVPSSHRWGQVFKPNVLVDSAPCPGAEGVELPGIENSPDSFGVQYIDVEPGDILAHHVLTLHGMEANRSKTPCRVLGFCYVDASLRHRRRPGLAIPSTHNAPPRDGAEWDPAAHPVVWPHFQNEALAS